MAGWRWMSSAQKIVVIGTSGAGKTTLARQLAQRLAIPHIELDTLHWEPGWIEVSNQVFQSRVEAALSGDRWVVDGNYKQVRSHIWQQADTLIWLDYSLPVIMSRLLRRTVRRAITQELVCNGNRENWRLSFFSRDSILLWALQTYHRRRREYPVLLQQPEYAHLTVLRLRSPVEAEQWLSILSLA